MTARPQPPPEARLIAQRRNAMIPKMSMRQAAQRMGVPFSAARWRQLESGIRRVGGTDFPETGPAETIARMARVVGVAASELTACGRDDAAQILAVIASPAVQEAVGEDRIRAIVREERAEDRRILLELQDVLTRILGEQREHRDDKEDGHDESNGSRRAG